MISRRQDFRDVSSAVAAITFYKIFVTKNTTFFLQKQNGQPCDWQRKASVSRARGHIAPPLAPMPPSRLGLVGATKERHSRRDKDLNGSRLGINPRSNKA
ncbi:hypothetical protein HMPREF1640_04820 [Prevotella sp. S7-1-8]|nr:hypothetical protein HMPREF1640_04820 [Prevotella sp. S7-1-8]